MKRNFGFNQYYSGTGRAEWGSTLANLYEQVGSANAAREAALSAEQADKYAAQSDMWSRRCHHYTTSTNYPDDLCSVLAARDVLNYIESGRAA